MIMAQTGSINPSGLTVTVYKLNQNSLKAGRNINLINDLMKILIIFYLLEKNIVIFEENVN